VPPGAQEVGVERVRRTLGDRPARRHESLRDERAAEDPALAAAGEGAEAVRPSGREVETSDERLDEALAAISAGCPIRV
jgi:hypothetical protein